jgi:hypothetical protein
MDPADFRQKVRAALGPGLANATPDNVRAFVAWFNAQSAADSGEPGVIPVHGVFELDGVAPATLEGGVKAFLDRLLVGEPEEARQRLWVALLELWYAVVEEGEAERLGGLFGEEEAT